jgi:ribosomal-protein-alanine N-acetyltransferase
VPDRWAVKEYVGVLPLKKIFPRFMLSTTIMREPKQKDIEGLFRVSKDHDVMKYYGLPPIRSRKPIIKELNWFTRIFRKGEGIRWIIALKESDEYIGDIGFHNYSKKHRRIEIGFKLAKEHWRRGIMYKSINKAIAYAFNKLRVNRIEALVEPQNVRSKKLLQKLGFTNEGILRQYEKESKGYVDLIIFSLLRNEWNN